MENTIGIKVKSYGSIAKCISIIRKYSKKSISSIKSSIEHNDYVLICDYYSTSEIIIIRKCYEELTKASITVEFFEDGEPTNIEIINNLIETFIEIDNQMDYPTDDEFDD